VGSGVRFNPLDYVLHPLSHPLHKSLHIDNLNPMKLFEVSQVRVSGNDVIEVVGSGLEISVMVLLI